jgi:NAD(P)-dependent dehydrogenase (short-subunit alcohol dehydrogenase family)
MSGRGLGDGPVTSCADAAWAEVLRVNLESAFRLMRAGLPALGRALRDERTTARLPQLQPLGARPVRAAEVAAAVAWLLSPASGQTTGASLPVDGGWTLR